MEFRAAITASIILFSSPALAYYDGYYENDGYSDQYSYSSQSNYYYDDAYGNNTSYTPRTYAYNNYYGNYRSKKSTRTRSLGSYQSRLPQEISSGANTIVVDPRVHAWGAYSGGKLIKAGLATAGSHYCPDIHRPCRTRPGYYSIKSLGSAGCKSTRYPVGRGGAPMPYCMYFSGNFALHGSYEVVEGNASHGCVRLRVDDARWLRYNFADIGTPVIIKPY